MKKITAHFLHKIWHTMRSDEKKWMHSHFFRIKTLLNMLGLQPNIQILDIGCGGGFIMMLIKKIEPTIELVGIEINQFAVNMCRAKGFEVQRCDVNFGLPYKSNVFDKIILSEVIEHLHRPVKLLAECNRVLKKKGNIVISTPNRERLAKKLRFIRTDCGAHYKEYTLAEICNFLIQTGFELKALAFSYWNTNNKFYNFIGSMLTHIPPLGSFIIVRAIKH